MNKGEASVQVTGLKPGHFYNIRVIASSSANFSTLGQLIRLRTLPSLGAKANGNGITDLAESVDQNGGHEAATVRPAPAQYEANVLPQIIRESSEGSMPSKRTTSGRRNSPASQSVEHSPSHPNHMASIGRTSSDDSVNGLTRKLDLKRQENIDLEKQIQEEEVQSSNLIAELTAERDQLRQDLKEKEDATAELRKQGNHLEKVNRQAQSRKAQKEQILNQKRAERQRIKEDIAKWDTAIKDMRQDIQELIDQKAEVLRTKDREVLKLRKSIAEEHAATKTLEEDIRAKGVEIKTMEKDRERFSDGGDEEKELAKQARDNEGEWEVQAQATQGDLSRLWQLLQQVRTVSIAIIYSRY